MDKRKFVERIKLLQKSMQERNITVYMVFMQDEHLSEYIDSHDKVIAYFTGFTGSQATLVVTRDGAFLWTDGRYFLQAAMQLPEEIKLMKQGEKDTPLIPDFVVGKLLGERQPVLGWNGRCVNINLAKKLEKLFNKKKGSLKNKLQFYSDEDIAGQIWNVEERETRPVKNFSPIEILSEEYAGVCAAKKLQKLRSSMEKQNIDIWLISALDEIAYLTNLRGSDIPCNPVFFSFLIITKDAAILYLKKSLLQDKLSSYLKEQQIDVREYEDFYSDLENIEEAEILKKDITESEKYTIGMDETLCNYAMLKSLSSKNAKVVFAVSPVSLMKAQKNETEIENMIKAHIKDGVAVTKFIYYIKTCVRTGISKETELSLAQKLINIRSLDKHYRGESFTPILAYKEHGAIIHYSADEESDAVLLRDGFLLADTGAQYLEGTTDETRTIVMGELTKQQKQRYTAVLCGNLRLMDAVFAEGTCGCNLDYLAREPLYRLGLDFNHGTGHGVGYYLNVHEGPNAIRRSIIGQTPLVEGMITSDEPGYYENERYGIRLENLLLCKKAFKTQYGQFYKFMPLTLIPFDLEAIDTEYMTAEDVELLNNYHKLVRETLTPYLTKDEADWLENETREVKQ